MKQTVPFQPLLPFYTLLKREVLRFLSVWLQTVVTPVISASLYLLVFGVSLGSRIELFPNVPYVMFVVPGLIMLGALNNSFANTSSSLFFARYIGNIVELLVTPITSAQFILAFTLAAILRAAIVGLAIWGVSMVFTGLPWAHPFLAILMLLLATFLFAQFGLVAAIYSSTFDHLNMFTNFLVVPLIYTGGLFYPVSELPPVWAVISRFNPLTYMIDGFRQSVLGFGSNSLAVDFGVTALIALGFFAWAWTLLRRGTGMRT